MTSSTIQLIEERIHAIEEKIVYFETHAEPDQELFDPYTKYFNTTVKPKLHAFLESIPLLDPNQIKTEMAHIHEILSIAETMFFKNIELKMKIDNAIPTESALPDAFFEIRKTLHSHLASAHNEEQEVHIKALIRELDTIGVQWRTDRANKKKTEHLTHIIKQAKDFIKTHFSEHIETTVEGEHTPITIDGNRITFEQRK